MYLCSVLVLGGFEQYDSLRDELLVILARKIFVGFCFLLELEKIFDLVQSRCITYKLGRNVEVKNNYVSVTWFENSSLSSCVLMVPIVLPQVHHNWKCRGTMHIEFNSICISHLWLCFWWIRDTTIGTTSPQLVGGGFSTQVTNQ